MTPEGKVKKQIKQMLDRYSHYRFMPVQMGMGTVTLDFLVCVNGHFLGIEAKAPGKEPTQLQRNTIRDIRAAGGETFVISNDMGLDALEKWLISNTK
jgi:hypothetical protein